MMAGVGYSNIPLIPITQYMECKRTRMRGGFAMRASACASQGSVERYPGAQNDGKEGNRKEQHVSSASSWC